MALAGQIEAAARPRRKPVVADVDHQSDHVLAGVGRTYGQPEEKERAAARMHARRLANRHGCILPALPRIALIAAALRHSALPLAALALVCGCPHPRHAADVADALTLLVALGLIAAEPKGAM